MGLSLREYDQVVSHYLSQISVLKTRPAQSRKLVNGHLPKGRHVFG
jgi:hypothetical protein